MEVPIKEIKVARVRSKENLRKPSSLRVLRHLSRRLGRRTRIPRPRRGVDRSLRPRSQIATSRLENVACHGIRRAGGLPLRHVIHGSRRVFRFAEGTLHALEGRSYRKTVEPAASMPGQVIVHELSSGRRSVGTLIDVSQGGIRMALAHSLADDEVVQLFFPRKSNNYHPEGRMIIGHVAHSKCEAGRHVVRIAFGWVAAVRDASRVVRKDSKSKSFFRPFSKSLKAFVRSSWGGRP